MPLSRAFCLSLICLFFATTLPAGAAVVNATWNSATDVPVIASSYTATGNTVDFTLNFAPATGTNLTVVNNTGLPFIGGAFDNLAQGQAVVLSYGGVSYNYVAHYYGVTGNDLVLVWAANRAFSWGSNSYGNVGDGSTTQRNVMVPVTATGVLAGKTILSLVQGWVHSLALCSDGTVAAWGYNDYGQLGNGRPSSSSSVPVLVDTSSASALHGKTVVALAAGGSFSLALCSDGTVAAWGSDFYGQLGDSTESTPTQRNIPVAVNMADGSALNGKTVAALAAGEAFSLALCSDGSVVSWGYNHEGQLGNNSFATNIGIPATVNTASGSALYGKTVSALAAGKDHSLAVCSDGSVVAWGNNNYGQLGNTTTNSSRVPVLVNAVGGTSALFGKSVKAVAAGYYYSMGLCADGFVTAWGANLYGQLGEGTTTQRKVPVAVNTASGVSSLYGKTVMSIAAGGFNRTASRALCTDGSMAVWGNNTYGDLGTNTTTNSLVPVPVSTSPLVPGEVFTSSLRGGSEAVTLALVAEPLPAATTLSPTLVTASSARLNGLVSTYNSTVNVSFDYGATAAYGSSITATPAVVSGSMAAAVSATLTGLLPLTTYHFRVNDGDYAGSDLAFTTPNNDARLTGLSVSTGMSPVFASDTLNYTATVATTTTSVTMSPVLSDSNATLKLNGAVITSGSVNSVNLGYGDNIMHMVVTAQDGLAKRDYVLNVVRTPPAAVSASYATGTEVPLSTNGITATGRTVTFSLSYAPATGANLMVVNNTGLNFIDGVFDNLAQGQAVDLSYNGINYHFVAHYFGGTGNDLVLVWQNNRAFGWGSNSYGEIGDGTTTNRAQPVPVTATGVLAGKTIVSLASGLSHTVALCSDGTLAAWGNNQSGQVGDGTTASRNTPVPVSMQAGVSALYGRRVAAIAAGAYHSLALCADGTLVAWGDNIWGQLGDSTTSSRKVPVVVNAAAGVSALYGRSVVSVTAGWYFNLALCSDGALVAWGQNSSGQLGNGTTTAGYVPALVTVEGGILEGRTVSSLSAGASHCAVLCSDGSLAAWGANSNGQLGNAATAGSSLPVAVSTASGTSALYGKTVSSLSTSSYHCLALCTDGTAVAWGANYKGQLGDNTTTQRNAPVAVNAGSGVSALYGRTVTALVGEEMGSLALCSDGSLASWGANDAGQLGDSTTTDRRAPVLVLNTLSAGEQISGISRMASSDHSMVLVAAPPFPTATTQPATLVTGTGAVLNGTLVAAYNSTAAGFEYGTTTAYGSLAEGVPTPVTDGTATPVSAFVTDLTPGTTYHFRAKGTNAAGSVNGIDQSFTTLNNNAALAGLVLNGGTLTPAFNGATTSYAVSVPYLTTSVTLIPTLADAHASMLLNGVPFSSGAASWPVQLLEGSNVITMVVRAEDKTTSQTYAVTVVRLAGPSLSGLMMDSGSLTPAFDSSITRYAVNVSTGTSSIVLTPALADSTSTMTVNGSAVSSGSASAPVSLVYGDNVIPIVVTSQDGTARKPYAVNVIRAIPQVFSAAFTAPGYVPLSISGLTATGTTLNLNLNLNFYPIPGSSLTVVNNTSAGFINGTFDNLAQGQMVEFSYNGYPYHFMANYFGGTGNDLVLEWADTRAFAWGYYTSGQLGVSYGGSDSGPLPLMTSGALSPSRMIRALAAGGAHSLALCWDGTVAAWGSNGQGQLGASSGSSTFSSTPLAVYATNAASALYGKNVTALVAGTSHSLALCTDGTVAAWGSNSVGQVGTSVANPPFALPQNVSTASGVSALYGRSVTAISAGSAHNLALCSDGTLVAWGANESGQLGNISVSNASAPVAVNTSLGVSALYGKTVVAISAGGSHSLALCSDCTIVAWGQNTYGQLGDNTTISRLTPIAVNTTSAVSALYGKTVVAIAAGGQHSLALCSDGTVVAWGANYAGQLGDGFGTRGGGNGQSSPVPRLVDPNGYSDLGGKFVTRIAAGASHSVAQCSDQTLVAWGDDSFYQLGTQIDGDPYNQPLQYTPLAVPRIYPNQEEYGMSLVSGPSSLHTLLLLGTPPPRLRTVDNDVVSVGSSSAVVRAFVESMYGYAPTFFEYGLTTAYGSRIPGPTLNSSGLITQVSIMGLTPGTTYHYRVKGGTYSSQDVAFTTLTLQQDWRQQNFGDAANTGTAADTADYDGDGIPNLLEYAMNLRGCY